MTDNQILISQYEGCNWLMVVAGVSFLTLIYVIYPPFTFWVDSKIEQLKNLMK